MLGRIVWSFFLAILPVAGLQAQDLTGDWQGTLKAARLAQPPAQAAAPASSPAEERVAFEVVSVRPVAPATGGGGRGGPGSGGPLAGCGGVAQFDPSRFSFRNVTVFALIAWAYGTDTCGLVNWSRLVSGPAWIKADRFDIDAVIPAGASTLTSDRFGTNRPPLLQKMLRTLLAERFKLVMHRENRDIPVYVLMVAKGGPKLRQSGESSCVSPHEVSIERGLSSCGSSMINLRSADQVVMRTFKMNLDQFAKILVVALDRPVINRTGLAGGFDITLEFAPDRGVVQDMPVGAGMSITGPVAGRGAQPPASGSSIFIAIQEQLGLKLEPSSGSVETMIIDHVEKPGEN